MEDPRSPKQKSFDRGILMQNVMKMSCAAQPSLVITAFLNYDQPWTLEYQHVLGGKQLHVAPVGCPCCILSRSPDMEDQFSVDDIILHDSFFPGASLSRMVVLSSLDLQAKTEEVPQSSQVTFICLERVG